MSEPVEHLFGWCSPNDFHHNRCRKTYVTAAGVTVMCSCPNHQEEQ